MTVRQSIMSLVAIAVLATGMLETSASHANSTDVAPIQWQDAAVNLDVFNNDLKPNRLTVDIVIYMPTNFDPAFNKVDLPKMLDGLRHAKQIFSQVDVQLKLSAVRQGAINPRFLHIQSNDIPRVPDTEYINSYEASGRQPTELSPLAKEAFETIIEERKDSHRTIYLIALQDVIMPFLDAADARNWTVKMVRTGGLSFPSYSYGSTIPQHIRGVMTISNLSTQNRLERTLAHELGHKLINVSHEYRAIDPAHEVNAEGGLMLYGSGTAIEAGADGRFHKERLHLSPYLYREDKDGKKIWNADYQQNGHYYDPIYGNNVVSFSAPPSSNPQW